MILQKLDRNGILENESLQNWILEEQVIRLLGKKVGRDYYDWIAGRNEILKKDTLGIRQLDTLLIRICEVEVEAGKCYYKRRILS